MTKGKLPPKNEKQNSGNKDNSAESKSNRRRYSDYFEFAPVGYFTFDRSGVILNVNSTGALLLGTDRDNLISQPFSAFIAPDTRDVFDLHSQGLFKSRKKQSCDLKLLNDNGISHWVQLESVASRNGNGELDQFRTRILACAIAR